VRTVVELAHFAEGIVIVVAIAAFVAFWAVGTALTWQEPIAVRLHALRTRRMKSRRDQA